MNNEKTTTTTARAEQPDLVKTIGRTTYRVRVYFSKTSKETITEKIFRLLRNEVNKA